MIFKNVKVNDMQMILKKMIEGWWDSSVDKGACD